MAEWPGNSKNMHEDVPTWQDNCFCEPEPRWQALALELAALEGPLPGPDRPGRPGEQGTTPTR